MKGNITRGNSFGGAVGYTLEKDGAELIGGTMSGTDRPSLTREFGVTKALRPNASRPVWHCSLSAAPGEHLSDQQWNDIAHDFMQRMKFDPGNNQYMIVRHTDTDKDHIHIVASRIGLDGKLWHGQYELKNMMQHTQQMEKDYGLKVTPGLEYDENHKAGLSRGEIEKSLRTGNPAAKLVLQESIDNALQDRPDMAAFIERLEAAGIGVRPNLASTGRCSGLSFEYQGEVFKASHLGKKYGFGQLQKRGLDYDQGRDLDTLKAAAERSLDAEITMKPGPEPAGAKRPQFKKTLDLAFKQADDGVYHWANHRTVAFVDHGDHIALRGRSATAVKGMIQLGQQKGWTSIEFTAHDRGMAAEMYRQARLAGYTQESISFDRTGPNAAQIEQIEREVMEREQNRSSQKLSDPAQQSDSRPDQRIERTTERQRGEPGPTDRAVSPGHGRTDGRDTADLNRDPDDRPDSLPGPRPAHQQTGRSNGEAERHLEPVQPVPGQTAQVVESQAGPSRRDQQGRDLEGDRRSHQQRSNDSGGADRRILDLAAGAVAPHIKAKVQAWAEQHHALQSPAYRLTLKARAEGLRTFNHGKNSDGTEKLYSAAEVAKLIPQLSRQNARGYDIYITPIDPRRHYFVLDDTDPERLRQMQQTTGIKPVLVQQSSPNNLQAIIIADRLQGKQEQSDANLLVMKMNKAYGDPKFVGVVHPFRMSGFMNAKPEKRLAENRRPITRPRPNIVELGSGPDPVMNGELQKMRLQQQQAAERAAAKEIKNEQQRRVWQVERGPTTQAGADRRYLQEVQKLCAYVDSKDLPRDWSRIDYAAAGNMLKDTGYSRQQIADAIQNNSPGIDQRKQDPAYYSRQTVDKAAESPEVKRQLELEREYSPRMS